MSDPTYPPQLPSLGRRGVWWWEPADYDASDDGIARLRALGVSWIVARSAVTSRSRFGSRCTMDADWHRFQDNGWVDKLHAAGILIATFIYPQSLNQALAYQEAQMIAFDRSVGADFTVLDMEEHYEEDGGADRASMLVEAIDSVVGSDYPLADAPWAWISAHPRFVPALRAVAPRVSAHMPQLYTTAFGFSHAAAAMDHYDRDWRAEMASRPSYLQRPQQPIFGLFDRTTPNQPQSYGLLDPSDIARFERRYGYLPLSYWSLHTATLGALDFLRNNAPPVSETDPSPPPPSPDDTAPITPRGETWDPLPAAQRNTASETPSAKREDDDHGTGNDD